MAQEKEKQSLKNQFLALRHLPRLFRLIWNTSKSLTIGNITLRLVQSLIPLATLYIAKEIIDEVVALTAPQPPKGEMNGDTQYLWLMVGIELGLAVFSSVLNRGIILVDALLGDLFSNRSSVEIMRHAAKMDLYQFEDATFYDKLERARRNTTGRTALMSQVFSQLQDIITLVTLGGGLVAFNPWLILILVVAVIPSFLAESYFNQRSYSLIYGWTPERRELDYLRYVGASDQTAKEVKIFNLADFITNRFAEISHRYFLANRNLVVKQAAWGTLLSALGTLAYYGAYVFIILQTISGVITLGTLTFLSGSFNRMQSLLQGIMSRFSKIAEGSLYLQDLFDFYEIQPSIISKPNSIPFPEKVQQGFTFENVGFKYQDSHKWAIRNLSFELKAGEKLALVGENGAGKTTLVKLLARLYEPTEGRILIDGVDIRDYNLDSLRNNIGIIFQDYIRWQMTAGENIAVGNIEELQQMALIEDSAVKSLANVVIEDLPNRYDQLLGKRFEEGTELSGGQWQKIALARAYMGNAQLLILDEPTSALDARAEHEVFLRFSELIEGKSAVLISHRFSTVRMADRILFMENGQLLELGTHEELLEKDGKYAELFKLQARGYQ